MATLYELTGQYLELLEIAEEEGDATVVIDTLEAIEGEIEDKADGYAKVLKELTGKINMLDDEIERLQGMKKVIKNNMDRIKNSLEKSMVVTGKKKFKTALFSFGIQKNPAAVSVLKESAVPEQFWKPQDPVLDKKGLLAYLKENGDTEYAVITQSESLRIR